MTPTERCPVSVPDEFRSVAISCWSDVQLSRIVLRPFEDALAVGRQAMKPLAALHDGDAKLLLELADASRQRRLADVARLSCPGEVLFPGQGDQVLQLSDIHAQPSVTGPQFNRSFK